MDLFANCSRELYLTERMTRIVRTNYSCEHSHSRECETALTREFKPSFFKVVIFNENRNRRDHLRASKCKKFLGRRGPAYDAPHPLVGWGGGNPSPFPPPRLRRLDSRHLRRLMSSPQILNRRYTYECVYMGPRKIFGPRAPRSLNPALASRPTAPLVFTDSCSTLRSAYPTFGPLHSVFRSTYMFWW